MPLEGRKKGNKISEKFVLKNQSSIVYIDQMDKDLTKGRDKVLATQKISKPNSIQKDQAMIKAAEQSSFVETAQSMKDENATLKDTGWKKAANLFEKIGMDKLSSFCDKKNEGAKIIGLAKSINKHVSKSKVILKELPHKPATPRER